MAYILKTIKYNPAIWRVPYDHVVWKDPKQILVIYCLQLLLVILLYPIPEDGRGAPPKNYFRHYFGRLHRPQDFQFLVDGMTRILNQPVSTAESLLNHKLNSFFLDASDNFISSWESKIRQVGTRDAYAVLGSITVQQTI
jgi:hypothetical protein